DAAASAGQEPVPARVPAGWRLQLRRAVRRGAACVGGHPRRSGPLQVGRRWGATAEVAPVDVSDSTRLALSAAHYGSVDVFFLDDAVFVEAQGFWVRGGQTTEVMLAGAPGGTTPTPLP